MDKPSHFPSLQVPHKAQRRGRALLGNAEEHRGVQAARDLGLPTAFLGSGPPLPAGTAPGMMPAKVLGSQQPPLGLPAQPWRLSDNQEISATICSFDEPSYIISVPHLRSLLQRGRAAL